MLSMPTSQFEASEKLTSLAFGSKYNKAPFSTLFDHVKDDAICLHQTERYQQTAICCAHEALTKINEEKQVNAHTIQYDLSRDETSLPLSSLLDGGANGGMTRSDVCVISSSDFHRAHVTGIGDATITDLPLITAAGFVHTHRGPAIVFLHQYAHCGKGHTIHSPAQEIRSFGTQVHDHSPRSQGGQQPLITSDLSFHALNKCAGSFDTLMVLCPLLHTPQSLHFLSCFVFWSSIPISPTFGPPHRYTWSALVYFGQKSVSGYSFFPLSPIPRIATLLFM
jgi:hypothetical protein